MEGRMDGFRVSDEATEMGIRALQLLRHRIGLAAFSSPQPTLINTRHTHATRDQVSDGRSRGGMAVPLVSTAHWCHWELELTESNGRIGLSSHWASRPSSAGKRSLRGGRIRMLFHFGSCRRFASPFSPTDSSIIITIIIDANQSTLAVDAAPAYFRYVQ